jgi:hypothetical protein
MSLEFGGRHYSETDSSCDTSEDSHLFQVPSKLHIVVKRNKVHPSLKRGEEPAVCFEESALRESYRGDVYIRITCESAFRD